MKKDFDKENKWEAFARDNAEFYVDTNFMDYPEGERVEIFFKSGQNFTTETLSRVDGMLPDKQRALEIGCGVGRLVLPHAQEFKEIIAVDIAPTMLKKCQENTKKQKKEGVKLFLADDAWDANSVSYAYSYLVFQHISDFKIIDNYIKRIAGCLKENGIAQLQFDTRFKTLIYKIRNIFPDFLQPKNQRKGIRRIRRSPKRLRNTFEKYELKIKEEIKPSSATHTFVLKKTASSDLQKF